MAQRQSPGNYTAGLRLVVIAEAQKQWKAMAEEAAALVQRYPSDATAWVYLGRSEAASGNAGKAAEAYRRVLQIVPGHLEATAVLSRK
jgi:cytochrome c-type biogenesis protein CcmH/NrfG